MNEPGRSAMENLPVILPSISFDLIERDLELSGLISDTNVRESNASLVVSFLSCASYTLAVPRKLSILLPVKFRLNRPEKERLLLLKPNFCRLI